MVLGEDIRLIHGDCFELMNDIPDKSVDLILTDIPYGEVNRHSNGLRSLNKGIADVSYFNLSQLVNLCLDKVKGSIYIFCGIGQISEIRDIMISRKLSTRLIVWEKTNPSPMNGQYIWLSGIECCVYGKYKCGVFNEKCKNSVIRFPGQKGVIHPTMKPIKMFEYLVRISSNEGDIILDPFAGSMTTAIAAINTNRRCICIEKDDHYFEIGSKRVKDHLAQQKLF